MSKNRENFLLLRIRVFKDESAFESLLRDYSATLQRYLHRRLPTHPDVEDAYSTLMLRLWEYITKTHVQHFSGLAHTIARAIVAEFYHQRERKSFEPIKTEFEEEGVELISEHGPAQMQVHVDTEFVKKGLKKLESEDDREAIILRYLEGYSVKEIARYLGKTENATSVLINRALKKLRRKLEKHT